MAKVKIPTRLIIPVIRAVVAAVEEITEATRADSDGGKRITGAEAAEIAQGIAEKLRPAIEREILKAAS